MRNPAAGMAAASVIVAVLAAGRTPEVRANVDPEAVLEGDIVVENATSPGGLEGVRVTFAVTAPRQRIWDALTDYEHFRKPFPGVEKLRVIAQNDDGATVEFWADAVVMDLQYVLRREYVEPGHRLTWHRVSGDLEEIEGSWRILGTGRAGVHVVIYESYVDVGFGVITWFVRLGARREACRMAQRLTAWIVEHRTIESMHSCEPGSDRATGR